MIIPIPITHSSHAIPFQGAYAERKSYQELL